MNRHILIVGNGSAEQAITGKLIESGRIDKVSVAPGNVPTAADDVAGLLQWATANRPDLIVVGPIEPLAAGIADAFQGEGLRIFGPTKAAAQIETSRVFAKQFMQRHNIPTAPFHVFDTFRQAMGYVLLEGEQKLAIKADGIVKGKDLYLTDCSHDAERAVRALMLDKVAGEAGSRIVIEEMLEGREHTDTLISDGHSVSPLAPIDVHFHFTDNLREQPQVIVRYDPSQAVIDALREEGTPFIGMLTTKLKFASDGVKLISLDAHIGDMQAQTVLSQVGHDLLYILEACLDRP